MKKEHSIKYISSTFGISLSEVARELGVTPQTINDWMNGRRNIPQKRLEQLSAYFDLPEGYFQKELLNSERLEVQKKKLEQEIKPIIIHHEQTFSFEEKDVIGKPIFDKDEMNQMLFKIEKAKIHDSFSEALETVESEYHLYHYEQMALLLKKFIDDPVLEHVIHALSIHYDILPDWVGVGDNEIGERFSNLLIKLFEEYENKLKGDE